MNIGLIADIHGDLAGFTTALELLQKHGADQILCAGDIVDRGPEADRIVKLLQEHHIPAIKGNHEHSVIKNQDRWRASDRPDRLSALGRIVSDETLEYLRQLPETLDLTLADTRFTLAHGTPWSDILGVYANSRAALFDQLEKRCTPNTDILIVGHTHKPLFIAKGSLLIVNPGSIYGVTIRDSHTCAMLTLPEKTFTVYDLHTLQPVSVKQ